MATENTNNSDYPIPKNEYLVFDATTIRDYLKEKLNETNIFTDQKYTGSYLSQIIELIACLFNYLMFYLNKTSSETMFSDVQIYENINRLTKLLGYLPIGKQEPILSFEATAKDTLDIGFYLIPRYSYININGIYYSFNEDIYISKTLEGVDEELTSLSKQKLLYGGKYYEYGSINAKGLENEIIYLTPGSNVLISHLNIDIYVKDVFSQKWNKWERVQSLYLQEAEDRVFEIRLNENKNYEIKFGNDINGKKLNENDEIAVYFLEIAGTETHGQVGANVLDDKILINYNSTRLNEILNGIVEDFENLAISDVNIRKIKFSNSLASTYFNWEESVESIRTNAPKSYKSQYRLVTTDDFDSYVKTNFSYMIHDIKTINNWDYLTNHIKYFYDLGITKPITDNSLAFNQINFSNSCNFNNIYLYIVSKQVEYIDNSPTSYYLTPAQKELIINSMQKQKILTGEVVIMDPVFMTVGLYTYNENEQLDYNNCKNSELILIKNKNSFRDDNAIISDVYMKIYNYFNGKNLYLGQNLNVVEINSDILEVEGVDKIYMRDANNHNIYYEGLSFLLWNPIYTNDIKIVFKNQPMQLFQFMYLNDPDLLMSQIKVLSTNYGVKNVSI